MKGKILKIRPGYNPNSSSAGLAVYTIYGVIGICNIIASIVAASIYYKTRKAELEKNKYERERKPS